jgi:methyl-accepting chemotaxis protein
MLSGKTSAILKENNYSVIYARDMSEDLTNINQEITNYFLTNKSLDSLFINKELKLFEKSLLLEKNNITETGEDKLASDIDAGFNEYRNAVEKIIKSTKEDAKVIYQPGKFSNLYQQLMLLSQMNENAIEVKTNDTKVSAKKASRQMSIVGTLCFLIAFGFTFSFGSYFNERFFQLYNGIKEIGSSNYGHRLYFDGKDEFYEISLVFNKMAERLSQPVPKKPLTFEVEPENDQNLDDVQDLKRILISMKNIEEQTVALISKLENKK